MSGNRKILRLINDDSYYEFKWKLKKYKIDIPNYCVDMLSGDTLLHKAVTTGQVRIAKYILKKGANLLAVNNDLEVPLHKACRHVLSMTDKSLYGSVVHPLLIQCSASLHCIDRWNITPHDLIRGIEQLPQHGFTNSSSSDFLYPNEEESPADEWSKKLAGEMEDEYFEFQGRYEGYEDKCSYSNYEKYDEWADRIHSEYKGKHFKKSFKPETKSRNHSHVKNEKRRTFTERPNKSTKEKIKVENKRLDKLKAKMIYEKQWNGILKSNSNHAILTFDDIPWPSFDTSQKNFSVTEDIIKSFFCIILPISDEQRKYMKCQQVRWHPDRFLQKLGSLLDNKDKDSILLKVQEISQMINNVMTNI